MPEENKIRDAADVVKGIVEAVPVYQDALQPAAKEVGAALETVAKAIHVALAPLSAMVWGYEKISDYLEKSLTERLKDVPPERIITPNPAIAGPTLESLRYTAQEPALRELYASLLASSMDSQTADRGHPAFVEVIRQMTPDEARLSKFLLSKPWYPVVCRMRAYRKDAVFSIAGYRKLVADADVQEGWIRSCLDNLIRLGLIRSDAFRGYSTSVKVSEPERRLYLDTKMTPPPLSYKKVGLDLIEECELELSKLGDQAKEVVSFEVEVELLETTALGTRFYLACIEEQKG